MPKPLKEPSIDELFNVIAPIAIYHGTDVLYRDKARKAIATLKRWQKHWPKVLQQKLGIETTADLDQLMEYSALDGCRNVAATYNKLFEEVANDQDPSLEFGHDTWGARKVSKRGTVAFSGDNSGMHAWYEDADALRNRLSEITEAA